MKKSRLILLTGTSKVFSRWLKGDRPTWICLATMERRMVIITKPKPKNKPVVWASMDREDVCRSREQLTRINHRVWRIVFAKRAIFALGWQLQREKWNERDKKHCAGSDRLHRRLQGGGIDEPVGEGELRRAGGDDGGRA